MGAAAATYIKSCRNGSKKVHGVNNRRATGFLRERRSRGRKEIQPLNFLFLRMDWEIIVFDRRQTCLWWNVCPQLKSTHLQVQIDVVSKLSADQATNKSTCCFLFFDFLLLSFLLPLSRCNKVGRVCILFLSSGTRRRSVETKFPKGCLTTDATIKRERREREREKYGIKTRYEEEKHRSVSTGVGQVPITSTAVVGSSQLLVPRTGR